MSYMNREIIITKISKLNYYALYGKEERKNYIFDFVLKYTVV